MWLTLSQNLDFKTMNKLRVRSLIDRLRADLSELESELLSDEKSYLDVSYDEVLKYYQSDNDDDGYPD